MRRKPRYPSCPTCGRPLPIGPNPAIGGGDAAQEILRRLTIIELRLDAMPEPVELEGDSDG